MSCNGVSVSQSTVDWCHPIGSTGRTKRGLPPPSMGSVEFDINVTIGFSLR